MGKPLEAVQRGVSSQAYIASRSAAWPAGIAVALLPDLDREGAMAYLRAPGRRRLAVMPSRFEVAPMMVAECLQAGLEFVATDLPGGLW